MVAPSAEPGRLPDEVTGRARDAKPTRYDDQVRPAQGVRVATPDDVKVLQIEDGAGANKLTWDVNSVLPNPLAVQSETVKLTLDRKYGAGKIDFATSADASAIKSVTKDGGENVKRDDSGDLTILTVNVDQLADKNGRLELRLWANDVEVRSKATVVTLLGRVTPFPTPSTPNLKLATVANTMLREPGATATGPVYRTDTDEPFFRLTGVKDADTQLRFVLQPDKGSAREVRVNAGSNTSATNWDAALGLPPLPFDTKGTLYVWQTSGNRIQTAPATPLVLEFKRLPAKIGPPTLGVPTATKEAGATVTRALAPVSTPDLPTYYTNGKTFTIQATKPAAGAEILTYAIGDEPEKMLPESSNGTITATALGDGDLVVRALGRTGSLPGEVAKLRLIVRTTPPRIEEVKAGPGFGQNKAGTDKIAIQFGPTDLIDTKVLNNAKDIFRIVHNEDPNDEAAAVRTANGGKVKIGLATFDATTNRVTLNVTGVVPGTYKLVILTTTTEKITDVFGNALAQQPVTNSAYLVELPVTGTAFTAADGLAADGGALPSQRAGVTLRTGPAVPFPEYLKPRTLEEGFNPSDRVETRVVRLYYYRDAHRVAQLVNRTVKSYNAATVDVRRRAADNVRDTAEVAEGERKRLESVAVRAAQDARAAEADLTNLQNGVTTARNQGATARIELAQRQQELEQARRDLARANDAVPDRTNAVAIANQQLNVNEANRVLGLTRKELERTDLLPERRRELEDLRLQAERQVVVEEGALRRLKAESRTPAGTEADIAQARVTALEVEIKKLQGVSLTADLTEQGNAQRISTAQAAVSGRREAEAKAVESWQVKEFEERRLRANQFRAEVAAAREDPDTYAPGQPLSVDPVLQVSVSVIGEGLIQLRGPIKGLNVIRTMVNQIDAPVGQVRVAVHTLQVNGERADRMEKVVANIQRYLDHSRFLTAQSSQMLRNAVTTVASRKATEVAGGFPNCSQEERDQKYLYAFFGKDFTDELTALDSEFLKTGNKLLSLHSMDSTSLSAGLFLMALAKNDVRAEIINEFQAMVMRDLPQAEWSYYMAGISQPKHCDACKDKKEYLLAFNSRFQSFVGFFNANVTGTDTLNPLQREFIKLAQIFKARMITEMQLSQRVKERALLEERVGVNYLDELRKAKELEDAAKDELRKLQKELPDAIRKSRDAVEGIVALIGGVEAQLAQVNTLLKELNEDDENNTEYKTIGDERHQILDPEQKLLKPTWIEVGNGKKTVY